MCQNIEEHYTTSNSMDLGAGWAFKFYGLKVHIENHIIVNQRFPIYCLPTHILIASYAPEFSLTTLNNRLLLPLTMDSTVYLSYFSDI